MPFLFFLPYVVTAFVFPGEVFPALAQYRIPYWLGMSGLLFSAVWLALKRDAPLKTLQLWLLVAFTVVVVVSRMVGERWLGSIVPTMNTFGPSLAMFVLTVCSVDSLRKLRIAAACIVVLTLALVAQGVAAYHFGYKTKMFVLDPSTSATRAQEYVAGSEDTDALNTPAQRESEGFGVDPDDELSDYDGSTALRIRGLGLLHDPNDLAMAFVMALPLLWAGWRSKAMLRNIILIALPSVAVLYGIFLTRSRGGVLAFVVIMCLTLARRIGTVAATLLFIVLMTGGMAASLASGRQVSLSDDSTTGRLDAWSEGLQMLKSEPVLGVGYGQFNEHHDLTAHNSLVLCFAETGLVGYFFWLGLLLLTYVQIRSLKNIPEERPIDRQIKQTAVSLEHAIVGFMIAAFFLSRTFVPLLYLLVGLSVALVLIARQHNRNVWSPSVVNFSGIVLASELGSIVSIYLLVRMYRVIGS